MSLNLGKGLRYKPILNTSILFFIILIIKNTKCNK